MTSLSESQIDSLLREAEQRLPSSSLTAFAPKPQTVSPESADTAQPSRSEDKLSVRQVPTLNPSEKVTFLILFFMEMPTCFGTCHYDDSKPSRQRDARRHPFWITVLRQHDHPFFHSYSDLVHCASLPKSNT